MQKKRINIFFKIKFNGYFSSTSTFINFSFIVYTNINEINKEILIMLKDSKKGISDHGGNFFKEYE